LAVIQVRHQEWDIVFFHLRIQVHRQGELKELHSNEVDLDFAFAFALAIVFALVYLHGQTDKILDHSLRFDMLQYIIFLLLFL